MITSDDLCHYALFLFLFLFLFMVQIASVSSITVFSEAFFKESGRDLLRNKYLAKTLEINGSWDGGKFSSKCSLLGVWSERTVSDML